MTEIVTAERQNTVVVEQPSGVVVSERPVPVVVVSGGTQGPEGAQGVQGPPGDAPIFTAGQILSGHRIVTLNAAGEAVYASNLVPADKHRIIGMTSHAAVAGDSVIVARNGKITEPGWTWTPELPIYLADAGMITQTPPVSGFSLIVGAALSATELYLAFREPIALN